MWEWYSKVNIVMDMDFFKKSESLLYIHFGDKLDISNSFLIPRLVSDILSKLECEERQALQGRLRPRFREQGHNNPRS